jgi:WD40 repeat protein
VLERRIPERTFPKACIVNEVGIGLTQGFSGMRLSVWDLVTGAKKAETAQTETMMYGRMAPEGSFAVSAQTQDLLVWDLQAATLRRRLRDHVGEIMSAVISADGRYVATGSSDWTVTLWDLKTAVASENLDRDRPLASQPPYSSVAVSADGNLAAAHSGSGVTLWDMKRLRRLRPSRAFNLGEELGYNRHDTHGIALDVGGKRVAAGTFRRFRVWDVSSGKVLATYPSLGWVSALVLSNSGEYAFAAADSVILRWTVSSDADPRRYEAHERTVYALDISRDGRLLISGGFDGAVCLWNVRSGKCIRHLREQEPWIVSVRLSVDGRRALSASADHSLIVWDLELGVVLRRIDCGAQLKAVAFLGDERHAVTIAHDSSVAVWDLQTGELRRRLVLGSAPLGMGVSGDRVLITDAGGVARVLDVQRGRERLL